MSALIILSLTCVILLAWSFASPTRRVSGRRDSRAARSVSGTYQSVSIARRACSCDAVADHDGRRFLAAEAPLLPVQGCNVARCDCRYRHHVDRRSRGDRRSVMGLQTQLYTANGRPERRLARGRRREDFETDASDFGLEGIEWVK